MQNRSGAIDALRVVGIVAIVAGHAWDNSAVRAGLYTWHVPLFFFLTGYLWTRTRPPQDEARKRARSLLIPYATWLVIIGALFEAWLYLRGEFQPTGLLNLAWGGNHLGRPFSAFWFVTALFVAAVALRLLQRLPMWAVGIFSVAGLYVAYSSGPELAEVPLSVGVAWPSLVFVLAGYGFRKVKPLIPTRALAGAALTSCGAVLAATGVAAPLDIKQADFGTPFLSVFVAVTLCSGLLLLSEALFSVLGDAWNGFATTLALGGFMVVLAHAVPLWALGVGSDGSPAGFIAALVAPWASALVLRRTPLAPYLLGVTRARTESAVPV